MPYVFNPFTGKLDQTGSGGGGATLGANTFTATQTITPPANNSALTASYSVTGANTTPLLDLSGTWNTTGIARGILLNITDTASNASSLLFDLQTAGTSRFNVDKNGAISTRWDTIPAYGLSLGVPNFERFAIEAASGSISFVRLPLGGAYTWTSGYAKATRDLFLYRDAANTLAQYNGTAAQTFRLYNTRTDGSNFERGFFRWNANVLEIGSEAGGTGSSRRVRIQSAESIDFFIGSTTRTITTGSGGTSIFSTTNWQFYSGASDPTTATTPFNNGAGTCAVYRNTTTGLVRLWVNNAGTMVSVALA